MTEFVQLVANLFEAFYIAIGNFNAIFAIPSTLSSYLHPFLGSMILIALAIWVLRFLLLR